LYTRITKQGWFDSNKDVYLFRGVIDDVTQFLAVYFAHIAFFVISTTTTTIHEAMLLSGRNSYPSFVFCECFHIHAKLGLK